MTRRWAEWLRWSCLAAAVVVLVVFLVAQKQTTEVSYGQSPTSTDSVEEGGAGELSDASVPSVEEMNALVRANPVTRLPGSIARWDEEQVRTAIGGSDIRILVTPPGLDESERDRVTDVDLGEDTHVIRITGTRVAGDGSVVVPDRISEWRAQFATADVTSLLLFLIARVEDRPEPADTGTPAVREPTPAELAPVVDDLRASNVHIGSGATLTGVPPEGAANAFPGGALFVALPRQPAAEPLPDYGTALTALFPDRPLVVMYGDWIEYHGPHAADFADVAAASFYGQFGERLSRYAYPQRNVLGAYLARVTDLRYAGVFDRPLPYQPFDPVRVALPALPWIFAACAVVFLVLSARAFRPRRRPSSARVRLAGLTALAIEVSGLSDAPALTRAIATLQSAREALDKRLPDKHVTALLDDASGELAQVAKALRRREYQPAVYLEGRLA